MIWSTSDVITPPETWKQSTPAASSMGAMRCVSVMSRPLLAPPMVSSPEMRTVMGKSASDLLLYPLDDLERQLDAPFHGVADVQAFLALVAQRREKGTQQQ